MTTFAIPVALRPKLFPSRTAANLMTTNPLAFDKDMPIPTASALLQLNDLEAAPVVDDDCRLVGTVTRESFVAWQEFSHRSSPYRSQWAEQDLTPVWQITNPVVDSLGTDVSALEVMQHLFKGRGRQIYIVNGKGKLVGVVSMTDLFRGLLECDNTERLA